MSSIHELPDELSAPHPPARLRVVPTEPLDFDAVVTSLTPRLRRYATRRLGDRHEAEELVQEALLRAYNHRHELATEDDVAAWSTCVTGRLVIDRLRVRGRSINVAEVPEGTRAGRDTADVVVAREQARLALDALDAMPARQAAVLWAREVEGLAYDQIGERFGLTEPAVRSLLSRARTSLRREFATRGGTLPAAGLVALAPWVGGLTWLDRLRRAAVRASAPAVLGAAGLGVLSGVLPAPWNAPAEATPAARPAVSASSTQTRTATPPARLPRPLLAATSSTPVRATAQVAALVAPATRDGIVTRSGLGQTCLTTTAAQAGGTSCDPERNASLYVGPPLPDNPTGVKRIGLESRQINCDALPALPMTTCKHSEGDPR